MTTRTAPVRSMLFLMSLAALLAFLVPLLANVVAALRTVTEAGFATP